MLGGHYETYRAPRFSYSFQCDEVRRILSIEIANIDRLEIPSVLTKKFGSPNLGLVDSIKYVLNNFEKLSSAGQLLAGLVWVDFYSGGDVRDLELPS